MDSKVAFTKQPQITWDRINGAPLKVTTEVKEQKTFITRSTTDITNTISTEWSAQLGGIGASLSVQLGFGSSHESEQKDQEWQKQSIDLNISMDTNDQAPVNKYTVMAYYNQSAENSDEAKQITSNFVNYLQAYRTDQNAKLLAKLCDYRGEDPNQTDGHECLIEGSNPYNIDYVVKSLEPYNHHDPVPPALDPIEELVKS